MNSKLCVRMFLPLLVLPALVFPQALAAQQTPAVAKPHWIWLDKTATANQMIILRKTFEVPANLKSAWLVTACDNRVTVFVNGNHLVQHDDWSKPLREDIAKKLQPGKNILALRCTNAEGAAGLLLQLTLEDADGKQTRVLSHTDWKAAQDPPEDWRQLDYDDSTWKNAVSVGEWGAKPWGEVTLDHTVPLSTPEKDITVPADFRVELLYSVPKSDQGSWVSMTTDPKGRLIVSDQYGSLYRVTPGADRESTQVEKLDAPIGDAQGLLYAFDSLYVTVNGQAAQGSGFYRLRDTDGDDQFDEVKLLKKFQGGGEHGPHGIRLGPDGKLYVIAGNHTKIPENPAPNSPHRNWAEDLLLPRNPDGRGHATNVMAPGGWIARTDENGETWELFCGGFRNPYDIDFNLDGELFTFDADMEWDTGTPWYRPTRVNHAVSAAEFGWRFGTGKRPAYYGDSHGAVVDIGLGSPTGISFGTGAKFPAKYQRALFINDWTYGKIYAVHMQPQGASYTATFETFVQGKPLPVTDIVVGADGALYFAIGGRKTQSGLYRVTYTGNESTAPAGPIVDEKAAEARRIRRQLEAFHGQQDAAAIETAWPYLNSSDRAIRYAARVAVEHQDPATWIDRAFAEERTTATISLMIALARAGDESLQSRILTRLTALPYRQLTEEQTLDALRAYGLAYIRLGGRNAEVDDKVVGTLDPLFPAGSELVNRELVQLLVYLEAPHVVERSLKLLEQAQTQQDQMHYVFVLRNVASGWTHEQREAYFSWMNLAETKYRGGASFQNFVQQIRKDASDKLSDAEKVALKDVLEGRASVEVVKLETTRQFVHNWQMEDLLPILDKVSAGRSFEKGRQAYAAAQCAKCHRFAGEGGDTGPDITGVGSRFDARYLLESLILPSKVVSDQYMNIVIETDAGKVVTGRVISEDDEKVVVRTDPFARELTTVPRKSIEFRQPSTVSEMPQGLINVLTQEEVLDLIAYLRSGGNSSDRAFQPAAAGK